MHANYSPLDILSYAANIATYKWSHHMLVNNLSTRVGGGTAQLSLVQAHGAAKGAQATSLVAVSAFLTESDSALILIPGVIDETGNFIKKK